MPNLLKGVVLRKLLFWAEQQQVAIPGWLREDQKEGLHQEEHFASRKQPRCPMTKKNEAKRTIPCCGGRGGGQDVDPSHLPPTPSGGFWSRACVNSLKSRVFKSAGVFKWQNMQADYGGQSHDFVLTIFTPKLKLMIFSRNFFNKLDAWNSYLGDASVKNHPPLSGVFWRGILCLYSELEVIIAFSEGGNFLIRWHFIAERKPPMRNVNNNKNKADHSSS